jgi:hypothetical protein
MNEILEIFWMNPIGQVFWILGMITVIWAFLQKNDKNIIVILIVAHLFWAVHFYYMWIYAWLGMVLVWTLRLLMSIKYKKNTHIFYWVLFITLILWMYTYKDIYSIFPILASCLGTYWFFFLEKIKLRLVLLSCSAFWFSFHYVNFSIGGVINESILQFIHIMTIYRLMVAQWWTRAYLNQFKDRYLHIPKNDYGRYLAIVDFIKMRKKK